MTYYKNLLSFTLLIFITNTSYAEYVTPTRYAFNELQHIFNKIFTPNKTCKETEELFTQATARIQDANISVRQQLIIVSIKKQKLYLFNNNKLKAKYTISTSKYGAGQSLGTKATPLGLHYINEKIGDHTPVGGVFKSRQYIGKTWQQIVPRYALHRRDFIVTRILRLQGLEQGFNSGLNNYGINVDSQDRGIYIHGTTMEWKIGKPVTIGCIHMKSSDIINLYPKVQLGTLVVILA